MVQQPFGPQASVATTLALPAIVAGQSSQLQNGQQQSAYSPQQQHQQQQQQQDNFYPQQILKNATQQQYGFQPTRMNGLTTGTPTNNNQQGSPSSSIQQDGLYNRAPLYAPKPTYFSPNHQAAAIYTAGRSPAIPPTVASQHQSLYQAASSIQQQQPQQGSPATMLRSQMSGLSVRQMPSLMQQPASLPSPQQNVTPQQHILQQQQALEQQQRQQQMQQLIMSYQQQQQQVNNSILHNSSLDQVISQPTYAQNVPPQEVSIANNNNDSRWNQHQQIQDESQRQLNQRHLYSQNQQFPLMQGGERLVGERPVTARNSTRFSDRDSVSTVSRFNQFDERRSITMRSQFTSAKHAANFDKNFGFVKLTLAAFKRIVGLSDSNDNNNQNMNQNLQMSFATNRKNNANLFPQNNNSSSSQSKVTTIIDSAENHYFNRKVFKYQLVITRCICFLSSIFVLLSPVAMLLIPKMEHIFNTGSRDYSSPDSSSLSENNSPLPSITHGVGLTNKQAALGHLQSPYYTPQPQWRISECTSDCDGLLIGFVTRFLMLCIAFWAIFFRAQTSTLPRIDFQRCLLVSMAVLITLSYWLFFVFRLFDKRFNDFELQYISIVQFSLSMLESLILLHYLSIIVLEIRNRKKVYCIKVVRSPDGESQYFSCGAISIQKCAEMVLEKYHRQFKQYNSYKEQLLNLEDRYARNTSTSQREREDYHSRSERSRPNSPTNSHSGPRSSRRPSSRSSRHHSRAHSPSPSPVRDRSRSQTKRLNEKGIKVYQVDLDPPSNKNEQENATSDMQQYPNSNQNKGQKAVANDDRKQRDSENSADQSSDTNGKMKESSLETVRAANSTSDLINRAQKSTSGEDNTIEGKSSTHPVNEQSNNATRDETESMRSGRSRRSTSRHHSRHRDRDRERDHHHGHKERSSSRAYDNSNEHRHSSSVNMLNSFEEHEKKLRRRKFRLLVAVQDAFQQIKRTCEGKLIIITMTTGWNKSD